MQHDHRLRTCFYPTGMELKPHMLTRSMDSKHWTSNCTTLQISSTLLHSVSSTPKTTLAKVWVTVTNEGEQSQTRGQLLLHHSLNTPGPHNALALTDYTARRRCQAARRAFSPQPRDQHWQAVHRSSHVASAFAINAAGAPRGGCKGWQQGKAQRVS